METDKIERIIIVVGIIMVILVLLLYGNWRKGEDAREAKEVQETFDRAREAGKMLNSKRPRWTPNYDDEECWDVMNPKSNTIDCMKRKWSY